MRRYFPRPLVVTLAALMMAGCPVSPDGDFGDSGTNIANVSRGGSAVGGINQGGFVNTGTSSGGSGSGTAFSCGNLRAGSGVDGDPTTGTNPSSVNLSSSLDVRPLYLDNGDFTCSVSNAKTAIAAITNTRTSGADSVQSAWSGVAFASAFKVQGADPLPTERAQDRAERAVAAAARNIHPASPSSFRTQAGGLSFSVGDVRSFRVLNVDPQNNPGADSYTVNTHAVYVYNAPNGGPGSFVIWADDADAGLFQGSSSKLATIASELQNHIYATDTCAFGTDTTVADNVAQPASKQILLTDDYVHFVFTTKVDHGTLTSGDGTLGFFTLADLVDNGYNKDKIVYIASSATSRELGDMFAVVAHEFQHLLYSCHRVKAIGRENHITEFNSGANTWLNEGLAMEAMLLNGYGPDGTTPSPAIISQVADYLQHPSQYSMTDFYGSQAGNPVDAYGMVTLFTQYLDDRLGDGVLKELHNVDNSAAFQSMSLNPTDQIERVLSSHGTSMARLFPDFAAALALDGTSAADSMTAAQAGRFHVGNVNLRGTYGNMRMQGPAADLGSGSTLNLRPFSIGYLAQTNLSSSVSLRFSGHSGTGYESKLILQK